MLSTGPARRPAFENLEERRLLSSVPALPELPVVPGGGGMPAPVHDTVPEARQRGPRAAAVRGKNLMVMGGRAADVVVFSVDANDPTRLLVTVNGQTSGFAFSDVGRIVVNTKGGDDSVTFDETNGAIFAGATLIGGAGNDTLGGGSGNDKLVGAAGDDHLAGGAGDDLLLGAAGSDELDGGGGEDRLLGGKGGDLFNGELDDESELDDLDDDDVSTVEPDGDLSGEEEENE